MPDRLDESSAEKSCELSEKVGVKESRKVRARGSRDRTLWVGLGMFGLVGWSIAVPTVIGIVLGRWLDRRQPSGFSWTLVLLLAGAALGCISAWYWVNRERNVIDAAEKDAKR